ncbi:RES family NAD+ phosphorylase [Rhodoplanes elegans]|uniref:RES family NAD+ phosphorylase n=1 Tax=Rhodoplanes elegans TaxID=29408 RepID=UPI0014750B04|nr:RES family NAD+ phosphorylase [Rhodoplanes elegans]
MRATTHRLIASRYPPVGVFDDLATDPQDLAAAYLLEQLTNDRLSPVTRRLPLLPPDEIVQGPGATLVMAAFLHADPAGGRFTDGRLGAWYAALDRDTAIAETVHHATRRLRLSDGAFPSSIQMRALTAGIDCRLVDLRGAGESRPELYDPVDYTASRTFGTTLRWPANGAGANGIVYDSVRTPGGTNVCVFRPSLVRLPVLQGDHLEYRWDRTGAVTVLKLGHVTPQPR